MQHSQKFLGGIFGYQYFIPKAFFYTNQTKQNNIDFGFLKEKFYVGLFIHCQRKKQNLFWEILSNKTYSENMKQIYRTPFALQLYWNHTSAWEFFCKFAAYFQDNFSWEHLLRAAFDST